MIDSSYATIEKGGMLSKEVNLRKLTTKKA
jgi:hypothetical protein